MTIYLLFIAKLISILLRKARYLSIFKPFSDGIDLLFRKSLNAQNSIYPFHKQ